MEKSKFLNSKLIDIVKHVVQAHIEQIPKENVFDLIQKSKKSQQQFYFEISVPKSEIKLSEEDFQELIEKGLLKIVDKRTMKVAPTLKALLMFKYDIFNPPYQIIKMLDDINELFFKKIFRVSEREMEGREKAVVLTLLGLGAISEKYPLKFDQNLVKNKEAFKEAVNLVSNFLKNLGPEYIDNTLDKLWSRNLVGEDEVSGELRRLNEIQLHTEGICIRTREGTYLKLLSPDGKLNIEDLRYLLKEKIFNKRPLKFEERKKLNEILDKISLFYNPKFFKENPPFNMLEILSEAKNLIKVGI